MIYDDFDEEEGFFDDEEESVKKEQYTLSSAMEVFEFSPEAGEIVDFDGKSYEICFFHKSHDGSCIYLKFTDNEIFDNRLIFLTAKYFPDICQTRLFPLTEWEDVALRLLQLQELMYSPDEEDVT